MHDYSGEENKPSNKTTHENVLFGLKVLLNQGECLSGESYFFCKGRETLYLIMVYHWLNRLIVIVYVIPKFAIVYYIFLLEYIHFNFN